MDLAWIASTTAFALSMSATPGPNNAMLAASGATWGLRRTVPHMLGIAIGFPVMVFAVAAGGGRVIEAVPGAQGIIRWIGVAYMLWLAWRIATAPVGAEGPQPGRGAARPLSALEAALFQWVNPKAWVIAVAAFATYVSTVEAAALGKAAALAAIFLAVALFTCTFWTLVGAGAARTLRSPRAMRGFNLAMAVLLVVSLLPLASEG